MIGGEPRVGRKQEIRHTIGGQSLRNRRHKFAPKIDIEQARIGCRLVEEGVSLFKAGCGAKNAVANPRQAIFKIKSYQELVFYDEQASAIYISRTSGAGIRSSQNRPPDS